MTELQLLAKNSEWLAKELLRRGGLKKSSKRELEQLSSILQENVDHLSRTVPLPLLKHKSTFLTQIIENHNSSVKGWYSSKNLRPMV